MKPFSLKRSTSPTGPRRESDSPKYMHPQYEQDLNQHVRDAELNKRLREKQRYVASVMREDLRHREEESEHETR